METRQSVLYPFMSCEDVAALKASCAVPEAERDLKWAIESGLPFKNARERYRRFRFSILARDNFTCRYCGARPPRCELHLDHVVPVSKGGETTKANCVAACDDCNLGKGVRLLSAEVINRLTSENAEENHA